MPAVHKPKGKKSSWSRRKRHAGIYRITNKLSNSMYIGRSVDIFVRWSKHLTDLFAGTHHNKALQEDFSVHNYRDYTFEIIELCGKKSIGQRERALIKEAKEEGKVLFNATKGG